MGGASGVIVRQACAADVSILVELSRRVQERLTASGSLQQFGPLAPETVAGYVSAGHAYVLDARPGVVGGTFVEAVDPERFPALARWGLDAVTGSIWFLSKLMIDPARQGNGLGYILLDGVKADIARRGAGAIVLDCWAGNETLRAFYTRAGFTLHGVFPAGGFEVAVFVQPLT